MRKNIEKVIEIPEKVSVEVKLNEVIVKFESKELKRTFDFGKISSKLEGNKINLIAERATRKELKMMGTIAAHLRNMIKGVQEDFVYKLEICNVHFPMNVKVEGDIVRIKSFLGEKIDRISKILPEVKVKVSGNVVEVSSYNIEKAGQTAANLEKATIVKGRDRRIFQDGIFITEKPGRII